LEGELRSNSIDGLRSLPSPAIVVSPDDRNSIGLAPEKQNRIADQVLTAVRACEKPSARVDAKGGRTIVGVALAGDAHQHL
jgi:hypothetical protein